MNLRETQQQLLDYLMTGNEAIKEQIVETEKVKSNVRLGIYGNAYALRLVEALAENYPALSALLGESAFNQLGFNYLSEYPSAHFSVRYFGHALTTYLLEHASEEPHLAELARFEWELRHAFDAEDGVPITLATLQAIPPEAWGGMQFSFQPSLSCTELIWNIPQLWQALEEDEEQPILDKAEYPITWRVWREPNLKIFYRSMLVDEAWALQAMQSGKNFAELCEGLCEWVDEVHAPQRAIELLRTWIDDGLIIAVDANE
jgi:hypothetical protein